jgi:hypothetical protein
MKRRVIVRGLARLQHTRVPTNRSFTSDLRQAYAAPSTRKSKNRRNRRHDSAESRAPLVLDDEIFLFSIHHAFRHQITYNICVLAHSINANIFPLERVGDVGSQKRMY